jgi:hypothetical protein
MELPESTLNVPIGTTITLPLEKAAVRQIDAAIDALEAGLFDVAITLAGAAEGMIERTGLHMFGELKKDAVALSASRKKNGFRPSTWNAIG